MTGKELRDWVIKDGMQPEELAVKLGISVATFYKWNREGASLDKRTLRALAQIGCPQAQNELEAPPSRVKAD